MSVELRAGLGGHLARTAERVGLSAGVEPELGL